MPQYIKGSIVDQFRYAEMKHRLYLATIKPVSYLKHRLEQIWTYLVNTLAKKEAWKPKDWIDYWKVNECLIRLSQMNKIEELVFDRLQHAH